MCQSSEGCPRVHRCEYRLGRRRIGARMKRIPGLSQSESVARFSEQAGSVTHARAIDGNFAATRERTNCKAPRGALRLKSGVINPTKVEALSVSKSRVLSRCRVWQGNGVRL